MVAAELRIAGTSIHPRGKVESIQEIFDEFGLEVKYMN